jgi:AcrR family transcriptional regulator
MVVVQPEQGSGLRRDALRNRQRLVEAAREVFAEQGLDAPLDEIARRAGVGNATLYRRFPTRDGLYAAVFAPLGDTVHELADRALETEDAWAALHLFTEGMCALTATDRGVCELIMSGFPEPPGMAEVILGTLRELVSRAHARHSLPPEITYADVLTAVLSVLLIIPASMAVAPDAWRRHLRLTLDGLHAHAVGRATEVPGDRDDRPLTEPQFQEVILRLFPAMRRDADPLGG